MPIFPRSFGSLRSQQLNSQIIFPAGFARISFLNHCVLLSFFEYLHVHIQCNKGYNSITIYCTSLFFTSYPFIYFLGEKDTPLIYFWCENDNHSYTWRPEKYTPSSRTSVYIVNHPPPPHTHTYSEKPPHFSCLLRGSWGSGGPVLVLNPQVGTNALF